MLSQAATGLFLDPGLGKTSTVLSAFKILKAKGLAKKMLIIAPLRPCYLVWPKEIEKWENFSDLTYAIVHGPNKEAALNVDADIYIINPEGLLWLYDERFKRHRAQNFDVLAIDESTKFKDSTTRRFKLLRPHLSGFRYRWILTGTPSPNGITDLFGQIYILDGGRALGKYVTHFRMEFFYQNPYDPYTFLLKPGAFERIIERTAPLVYRLKAEDYLKMPEQVVTDLYVDLPDSVRQMYKEVEDEFITDLGEGKLVAANAAVAGGKCRQIANGAVYTNAEHDWVELHREKLTVLEDLVEELAGKPVIIAYEFNHDRERLCKMFPDAPVLGSGLSGKTLANIEARFNAGEIPVLLGHPASMGHGLNLQGSCHHIIWFSLTWNLEHYDQLIARVYRQGQKSDRVFIYHILARDTRDEAVAEALSKKDRTQKDVLFNLESYRRGTIAV